MSRPSKELCLAKQIGSNFVCNVLPSVIFPTREEIVKLCPCGNDLTLCARMVNEKTDFESRDHGNIKN